MEVVPALARDPTVQLRAGRQQETTDVGCSDWRTTYSSMQNWSPSRQCVPVATVEEAIGPDAGSGARTGHAAACAPAPIRERGKGLAT